MPKALLEKYNKLKDGIEDEKNGDYLIDFVEEFISTEFWVACERGEPKGFHIEMHDKSDEYDNIYFVAYPDSSEKIQKVIKKNPDRMHKFHVEYLYAIVEQAHCDLIIYCDEDIILLPEKMLGILKMVHIYQTLDEDEKDEINKQYALSEFNKYVSSEDQLVSKEKSHWKGIFFLIFIFIVFICLMRISTH
ncbi:hypothetical protein ID852_16140 [Xenorhabdus sp. 42]|uniref:hypothetical protein n=1 Tax=Xenorhabdus szentirmaii TaxID=290112 RepID=UPI00199C6C4C|nr:hypothetical protein [Xenorhabdus sp. 42]MBD2822186.1 hypothetical protein [Xenorhabdus sp. 42]